MSDFGELEFLVKKFSDSALKNPKKVKKRNFATNRAQTPDLALVRQNPPYTVRYEANFASKKLKRTMLYTRHVKPISHWARAKPIPQCKRQVILCFIVAKPCSTRTRVLEIC